MYAGNAEAAIQLLGDMTPEQRQAASASAERMVKLIKRAAARKDAPWGDWGQPPSTAQRMAGAAVALIYGNAKDAIALHHYMFMLVRLALEFRPPGLDVLADDILERSHGRDIRQVQRLIAAGLVSRPSTQEYTFGLMLLFQDEHYRSLGLEAPFIEDPGLEDALLRIMEIEGPSHPNLAELETWLGEWRWSKVLLDLVDRGKYSRDLLLDKTLSALERDWMESRSSWFRMFHDKLDPTVAEMRPHATRYLALLESRIPTTVSYVLGLVMKLEEAQVIAPDQLLGALRRVASSAVRKQVEAALKLLDRVVKRQPSIAKEAAASIVPALAHESADVQKQVLRRLDRWGLDEVTRAALVGYQNAVAAVNREELRRLGGHASRDSTQSQVVTSTVSERIEPLDASRRIEPITSVAELVDRVAYVFENSLDLDELERVIAALAAAAPLSQEARERFAPVAQRLPKLRTPLAHEVGRVLLFLLKGERLQAKPMGNRWGPNLADQHLIRRVDEVMTLAALGKGLVPLTTPTHRRGFIDPLIFVERVREHLVAGASDSLHEQASALLRLAPTAGRGALEAARNLPNCELTRALRYALGDDIERAAESGLFAAAARIRRLRDGGAPSRYQGFYRYDDGFGVRLPPKRIEDAPEPIRDPVAQLEHEIAALDKGLYGSRPTVGGRDHGSILYHSTLVPSDLETVFADGAGEISECVVLAAPQNAAYVRLLLDPTVVMSPMATLLLAVGLTTAVAEIRAIAVDALVRAHNERRLEPSLLAAGMRDVLLLYCGDMARYAKSFREALRIDPAFSGVIFEMICDLLEFNLADPPKGTNAMLELLLEIAISDQRRLSERGLRTIEQLVLGDRGRSLRKTLLERATPATASISRT